MRYLALICLTVLPVLAACGYSPPPQTDTASKAYQTDREACGKSVQDPIDKRNAKKFLTWTASGVTRWSEIDDGLRSCMVAKGWGATRPCTDEERRRGSPGLAVTARGITCTDPGRS